MSKKIIDKNTTITIEPTTKDTTYVIDKKIASDTETKISLVHNETASEYIYYSNATVKKGTYDLVVADIYYNDVTFAYTPVVTTIKDYFKYAENNKDLVTTDYGLEYDSLMSDYNDGIVLAHGTVKTTLSSEIGDSGSTKYKNITSSKKENLYELGGNDKYELNLNSEQNVYDYSGNDKYTTKGYDIHINDYKGKDSYTVNGGTTSVSDSVGNDKYNLTGGALSVSDYAGKDKYTAKNGTVEISDYGKSNDTYNFSHLANDSGIYGCVNDSNGNDKYTMNTLGSDDGISYFYINEYEGKDSYSITGRNNLYIYEYSDGNDTYKINKASGIIDIFDDDGNNKFTVTNSTFTHENWNEEALMIYSSYDTKGQNNNDTFTLKNVKGTVNDGTYSIQLCDLGGSDKFNLTNVDYVSVYTDNKSTDSNTYNIKQVTNSIIISDNSSKDTYTFNKLDKTSVYIDDEGGSYDKLVIKGEKYNKTKGVIAIASGYGAGADCNLHLYDTKSRGFVTISNFYGVTSNEITEVGAGCIETVKVGSKTVNLTDVTFMSDLNALNNQVSSWLTSSGNPKFTSVDAVFESGSADDVASLVQVFQGGNA